MSSEVLSVTRKELEQIMRNIRDCSDYLECKQTSKFVLDIADAAARRAVTDRMNNLYDRLREDGLRLCEEEV